MFTVTVGELLFGGYLGVLSVLDMRTRKISGRCLLIGGIGLLVWSIQGRTWGWNVAVGIGVGLLFLGISKLTRESIGYGDSLVILLLGGFVGGGKLVWVLLLAFFLAGIYAMLLLCRKRNRKHTCFAFVPFLTLAYVLLLFAYATEGGIAC